MLVTAAAAAKTIEEIVLNENGAGPPPQIGTGFSDEDLKTHTAFFHAHTVRSAPSYYQYDSTLEPDVWFDAVQVGGWRGRQWPAVWSFRDLLFGNTGCEGWCAYV